MLLHGRSHHHCLDSGHKWCGYGIIGQVWLECLTKCFSSNHVVVWSDEDVLVSHPYLEDFLLDALTSHREV